MNQAQPNIIFIITDQQRYDTVGALGFDYVDTPVVDGRGLKHTLERRVFELLGTEWDHGRRFRCAFVPVAIDRQGLVPDFHTDGRTVAEWVLRDDQ